MLNSPLAIVTFLFVIASFGVGIFSLLKNPKSKVVRLWFLMSLASGLWSGFFLLTLSAIEKGIAGMPAVPGRLERIKDPHGRFIFIDYAHTPDALKSVLTELKHLTKGKIITVFGCGGDRDRGKRPKMGFETARLSDICLVTSDNPRTEDPDRIIAEILPGVKKEGKSYLVEPDRKKAISLALKLAKKGDVVLVAGKGHEDYQIIGTKKYPFSDHEVVRKFL